MQVLNPGAFITAEHRYAVNLVFTLAVHEVRNAHDIFIRVTGEQYATCKTCQ